MSRKPSTRFALRSAIAVSGAGLLLGTVAGCHTMSNSAKGTLVGGGAGGVAGAIIGHQLGHRDTGAFLGALAGGATGALVGNEMDVREERDAAVRYSERLENAIVSDSKAMTNYDLARLTASGASDEVIIAAVRSCGGKFDLSPDGLIQLKALGVSDRVILAVQEDIANPPTLTTVPAVAPAAYQAPVYSGTNSTPKRRRPWWRAVPKNGPPSESKWW